MFVGLYLMALSHVYLSQRQPWSFILHSRRLSVCPVSMIMRHMELLSSSLYSGRAPKASCSVISSSTRTTGTVRKVTQHFTHQETSLSSSTRWKRRTLGSMCAQWASVMLSWIISSSLCRWQVFSMDYLAWIIYIDIYMFVSSPNQKKDILTLWVM